MFVDCVEYTSQLTLEWNTVCFEEIVNWTILNPDLIITPPIPFISHLISLFFVVLFCCCCCVVFFCVCFFVVLFFLDTVLLQ